MATGEQIKANQQNSKFSTGPRSEAGLKSSSKNANEHGFTGHTLLQPPGEEEPFRVFKEKHLAEPPPNLASFGRQKNSRHVDLGLAILRRDA